MRSDDLGRAGRTETSSPAGARAFLFRLRLKFFLLFLFFLLMASAGLVMALSRGWGSDPIFWLVMSPVVLVLCGCAVSLFTTFFASDSIRQELSRMAAELRAGSDVAARLGRPAFRLKLFDFYPVAIPLLFLGLGYQLGVGGPVFLGLMVALSLLCAIYIRDEGKLSFNSPSLSREPWLFFWKRGRVDLRELRGYRLRCTGNFLYILDLYDQELNLRFSIQIWCTSAPEVVAWAKQHLISLSAMDEIAGFSILKYLKAPAPEA